EQWDLVINIQGDEPLIEREQLEPLIQLFHDNPEAQIGTLCTPIHDLRELESSNVVKVVLGQQGQGLYFSRSPIPFFRDRAGLPQALAAGLYQKHVGLYAFRPPILKQTAHLAISSLERAESLEQLRWLEAGMRIFIAQTDHTTIGVDTPEDLERAAQLIKEKRS
ncbi:MAG: 3-deoxy-manno-octulosonate cytidylyltransferase, partial [Bacteroidota bacterium]